MLSKANSAWLGLPMMRMFTLNSMVRTMMPQSSVLRLERQMDERKSSSRRESRQTAPASVAVSGSKPPAIAAAATAPPQRKRAFGRQVREGRACGRGS